MKLSCILAIALAVSTVAFSQSKPLTQAEFVKLLYALQKEPDAKTRIVEALRSRGIDFVLTDGIRGLARSKSGNDEDLRRALEEAERRRRDPAGSVLPPPAEAAVALERTRTNTLAALDEMPDFVVKQQIQRSAAYAGTGNYRDLDKLVVAVSYRAEGQEEYKVLSLNGVIQNDPKPKQSYEEVGGTSSTGEFVTVLATIFKPESETRFEAVETDVVRGRRAIVFNFDVDQERARQTLGCKTLIDNFTRTGMKGRIWIDRADFRVLRIESEATGIPANFPCPTAKRIIDYDWATIADQRYLLPLVSDVRLTVRDKDRLFETRNLIRFKNYQKYGSEIRILDDDETTPAEEKKPQQ
ncbi:MAG: hypothetical protein ACK4S4_12460 [Pyrinomonadaceae bacterium]